MGKLLFGCISVKDCLFWTWYILETIATPLFEQLLFKMENKCFGDFCLKLSLRIWFLTVDKTSFCQSPKTAADFKVLLPYPSYLWRKPSASEKGSSDSWIAVKIMFLPAELFGGCALAQGGRVCLCASHSYLLCCSHAFEKCSCSGFFWVGAITMHMG